MAKERMYGQSRKDIKGMSKVRSTPMSKTQKQLYRKLGKVANKTPYAKEYHKVIAPSKPKKKVKVRSGSNPPTIKKLYEPKKTKKGKDIYKMKAKIKSGRIPKKKTKKKEAYLIDLKREKEMAEKGWKVVRTKSYLKKPKKAIGKKGYPYAVLNKDEHYESFYTWEEKTSKKRKN